MDQLPLRRPPPLVYLFRPHERKDTAGGGWPCCTSPANRSRAESAMGWLMPASRAGYCFATWRKAQSIRMRLGGNPDPCEPFPAKPRRMHRRTYLLLRAQAEEAEALTLGRARPS